MENSQPFPFSHMNFLPVPKITIRPMKRRPSERVAKFAYEKIQSEIPVFKEPIMVIKNTIYNNSVPLDKLISKTIDETERKAEIYNFTKISKKPVSSKLKEIRKSLAKTRLFRTFYNAKRTPSLPNLKEINNPGIVFLQDNNATIRNRSVTKGVNGRPISFSVNNLSGYVGKLKMSLGFHSRNNNGSSSMKRANSNEDDERKMFVIQGMEKKKFKLCEIKKEKKILENRLVSRGVNDGYKTMNPFINVVIHNGVNNKLN